MDTNVHAEAAMGLVNKAFSAYDDVQRKAEEFAALDKAKQLRIKEIDAAIALIRLTEKGKIERINAQHSGPMCDTLVKKANLEATEKILPYQLEAKQMWPSWGEGVVGGIERAVKKGFITVAGLAGTFLKAPIQGIREGFNVFKNACFGKKIDTSDRFQF